MMQYGPFKCRFHLLISVAKYYYVKLMHEDIPKLIILQRTITSK